jgi:hypothetical protein
MTRRGSVLRQLQDQFGQALRQRRTLVILLMSYRSNRLCPWEGGYIPGPYSARPRQHTQTAKTDVFRGSRRLFASDDRPSYLGKVLHHASIGAW